MLKISFVHVQIQEPASRSTIMTALVSLAKFAKFYYHKIFETRSQLFLLPKFDSSSPSIIRDKEICQSHVSTQWKLFLALLLSLLKSFIFEVS